MIQMIPYPKQHEIVNETRHTVPYVICAELPAWERYARMFTELFAHTHGRTLERGVGGIELVYDNTLPRETYTISSEGAMTVAASDPHGLLYGLASAFQLITPTEDGMQMQSVHVRDYPEKDYRAVMVDLSRCWHAFPKLLKFVDLCFLYKIKYLHLHFIDDVLYTLPSRAFPKLPTKDRHYTFEQIEELKRYAADRGVVLVPEIECPGHALPLNRAYPEVFANRLDGETDEFRNESGEVYDTNALLCAGSERAMEGLYTLIREVTEMFPDSPYINIGGDEANIALWEKCPDCRAYMERNGIEDVYELYSDYIGRACRFVLSLGKTPIVWEGFPQKGCERVPRETVVLAWESHYHLAPDLLKAGFCIINASWQPLYVVTSLSRRWSPLDVLNWNVYNWQHWWPKSAATEHPINVEPTDRVLGAMMCAWCTTYDMEIARLIENLLAMSERTWSVELVRPIDTYRTHYRSLISLFQEAMKDI